MRIKFFALMALFAICAMTTYSFAEDQAVLASKGNDACCTVTTCKLDGGHVYAKINPSTDWQEVAVGQTFKKSDSIKTDASSSLILQFPGGTSVSIRPNTEITIDELIWDNVAKKVNIGMNAGEIRTIFNKAKTPSEFKVRTPTAICGARGTVFYVKSDANSTSIYVGEGSVDIVNPVTGEVYTVVAGMMITINTDGSSAGPVTATDTDVTGWTACYTDLVAEPYTPVLGNNKAMPPKNTPERVASGS